MRGSLGIVVAAAVWAGSLGPALAQGAGKIYTCVDSKGRRLTSDRPILDCIDREQQELGPTGQVVRKIGPSLTAEEQRIEDEKRRRELEERQRLEEEKRRNRMMLERYPDRAAHDKERAKALAAVDEVIATANRRTHELTWLRKKLDTELEFYSNDMKKAPTSLKRRIEETDQSLAVQKRFIANQEDEKRRINVRFDEELKRLQGMWATASGVPAASASTPASSPARAKK